MFTDLSQNGPNQRRETEPYLSELGLIAAGQTVGGEHPAPMVMTT